MPSLSGRQPLLVVQRRPATTVSSVAAVQWEPDTVFRWLAALTVGLVLILGGWWSVAGKALYSQQVAGLAIALGGTILAQAGGLSFLLHGRRAVGIRRMALLGEPRPGLPGTVEGSAAPRPLVLPVAVDETLVAAAGRVRFHRPSCALAADRDVAPASRQEHVVAGRRPCGVCQP